MTPNQRLAAIDDLITDFERSVVGVERSLLDRLSESARELLENPAGLPVLMRGWRPEWIDFIQDMVSGILTVADLNREYFETLDVDSSLISSGRSDLMAGIGITAAGVVIDGGYTASLLNDTSISRQVLSVLFDVKLRQGTESGVVAKLKTLVTGKSKERGIVGKFIDTLDVQPHVEADRYMQQAVGLRAGLKARLYLGGLIDTSRPFCVARNGKVFLDSEIEKFGTPSDKYGGYSDKSTGQFSGKPKLYEPFSMCGGRGCRHGLNVISNAEALRRRDDLEEVNGVLRIKKS